MTPQRALARLLRSTRQERRAMLSWLFVAALLVLCGVLGVLQYRWIGEVSVAARERLRDSLQATLNRLSRDFNLEIISACRAVLPFNPSPDLQVAEAEFASRYEQWKRTSRHGQLFRRLALANIHNDVVVLRMLDLEKGVFETSEWPEAWKPIKDRIEARISPGRWTERTPPPPPFEAGPAAGGDGALIEIPVFGIPRGGGPRGPFGRGEFGWAIIELNLQYVREVVFPEVLQSHLGTGGTDYQVEVVTRTNPPAVIYQSDPDGAANLAQTADASVGLFEPHYEQILWRWRGRGMRDRDREPERMEPPRGPSPGPGRWEMYVRHRAGSLEAVVSRARWRNLAVTAGVLLLMLASIAALVRYTRQAQKLAELQMEFVAGVSHELRTPLTVIHTAAYNLRGKLANNPAQVERYGSLIQQESGRLKELVEQTLRFAGTQAGHAINKPEPVCVESVVQAAVESSQSLIRRAGCAVEKSIAPGLPLVLGDPMALKHAFENLISNAVKYGTEGSNWIGISVLKAPLKDGEAVEVRVADHGPGIPEDEQEQVFDPFFRGRRALQEQVHGTGLGLNLVKKIVEAHGGKIRVNSQPMKGAEFIVRLPAAPPEQVDEFADSAGRG